MENDTRTLVDDNVLSTFAIVIVTFQITIMLLIVSGNILVLCAFKRFNHLQTSTGKFIANLAAADLCLGLFLPFQISFFFNPKLNFVVEACLLRFEVIIFTSTSSLLSLFFTVVDRYIAIQYPLRYHVIITEPVANIFIGIVWIYALILSSLPLLGYNSYHSAMICAYELVMTRSYRLTVALHFIILPIIMFIIYFRVFYTAWSHKKKILSEQIVGCYNITTRIQRETKTALIMAVVMLSFLLCWLPFAIIQVMQAVEFDVYRAIISNYLVFLGLVNSVINPFIYVWKNKQYKDAFRKIICFCKRFQSFEMNSWSRNNSANMTHIQVLPLQDMSERND